MLALEISPGTDDEDCVNYSTPETYPNDSGATYPIINGNSTSYYSSEISGTPTFYILFPDGTYTNICSMCENSSSPSSINDDLIEIIENWSLGNSSQNPFGDPPNSDCNSTILIESTTEFTLDGSDVPLGTWVGVFYVDGSGDYQYGGGTEITGQVTSIAAWGSEAGLDNGFQPGDEYVFGIVDPSSSEVIYSNNSNFSFGTSIYSCNNLSGLSGVEFASTDSSECLDDDSTLNSFGLVDCAFALNVLGCEFIFAGQPISSICPLSCGTCDDQPATITGCTNAIADNYNPNANTDDGSCIISGCLCNIAVNYNPEANLADNSCVIITDGCSDLNAINYSGDTCSSSTFLNEECEYENTFISVDWNDDLPNTDCNATILIESTSNITVNGEPISEGDVIGVFYSNSFDELVLGGSTTWTGQTTSIAAWGSEAGQDNGFQVGEEYTWLILDIETNLTAQSNQITMLFGENTYLCNGLSGLETLSTVTVVSGCTDPLGLNYNENAEIDDESCCYVSGCTDTLSFNYNPNACFDDDSCIDIENGCTDDNAFNYNPLANTDDGSCCFVAGCTSESAFNYNPLACFENNSCEDVVVGCLDNVACNFNPDANTGGFCEYGTCSGCTNSSACNFDINATIDDDSCDFAESGYDCNGDCLETTIVTQDCICGDYETIFLETDFQVETCTLFENCYCDCLNDINSNNICDELESGCTDPNSYNYDINALINDDSCISSPFGDEPNTECNATILVPEDLSLTIDGTNLNEGWIGVFYENSDGNLAYGGGTFWNGEVTNIAAWGSEANSNNGFQNQETYNWGYFDINNNQIIYLEVAEYSFGENFYACNSLSGISNLSNQLIPGCLDESACNYNSDANTNDNSCLYSSTFDYEITNNFCYGENNGSISIISNMDSEDFTYSWSNGQTTENISDLFAGDYTVIINQNNECNDIELNFSITEPQDLNVFVDIVNPTCPNQNNGEVNLTVSGGTPPYFYDEGNLSFSTCW